MNTLQLLKGLKGVAAPSTGVYPADRIPIRWPRPFAMIANTDNHNQSGTHWIAMYLVKNGYGVYLDSFGQPPMIRHHHHRLRLNSKNFVWNKKSLQSFNSTVCGHYCLMFLHYMCRGYSLQSFCDLFADNYFANDNIVRKFQKKIMKNLNK